MKSLRWTSGVLVAMCCLVAACGNSDVGLNGVSGDVRPGFFIGKTEQGGDLSIAADTIHAIFFECGGNDAKVVFDPPEPVAGDGSFAVEFTDAGRHFTVTGRFTGQNHVEGRIDGDVDCDGHFEADRCNENRQDCGDVDGDLIPDEIDPDQTGPQRTPTPIPTTPGNGTVTASVTTGPVETETPAVSPTPSTSTTHTPVPTSTPVTLCGNGILDILNADGLEEECDGILINSEFDCGGGPCVCGDFCDDDGGTLACGPDCRLDFSHCSVPPCVHPQDDF